MCDRHGVWRLGTACILTSYLLLLLSFAGCSGPGALSSTGAAGPAPQASVISTPTPQGPFLLPNPSAVRARLQGVKSTSSLLTRDASDFVPGLSQHVIIDSPEAVLGPDWADGSSPFSTVAYAVYRFDLRSRTGVLAMHTAWSTAPKDYQLLWLGASNWQRDRWDWYSGAPGGMAELPEPGLARYRRPGTDEMYVAVVLLGKSAGLLKRVWVSCSMRGDWWMYGREPGHSACSPFLGPDYPTLHWQRQLGPGGTSPQSTDPPVYDAEGTLYAGINGLGQLERELYAINPDGSTKWVFQTEALEPWSTSSIPAIDDDGTLYWIVYNGALNAVTHDGDLKWAFYGRHFVSAHPVIGPDGTIYVVGSDGTDPESHYLYAVNHDGSQRWEYALGTGIGVYAPAVAADGTVYAGIGKQVIAVTPEGTMDWVFTSGGKYQNSKLSLGPDGKIYFASDILPVLYALNPDGRVAWSYPLPEQASNGVTVGPDGTLYAGCQDGTLYPFSPEGELRWTYRVGQWLSVQKPAVDAAGVVYVAGADSRLYALNPDGTLKWWYVAWRTLEGGPVLGEDGTVYFADDNARIYALGPGSQLPLHTISGYVKDQAHAGIADVVVTISGEEPVLTDATGYWIKPGVSDGIYLVAPTKDGCAFSPQLQIANTRDGDVLLADFVSGPNAEAEWPMWGRDRAHTRRSPHLGPETPLLKWSINFGESVRSAPVIGADWAIYVQGMNGKLAALNTDGTERWHFLLHTPTEASPALGPDGTIYTNNDWTLLYAISPGGVFKWTAEGSWLMDGSVVPAADGLLIQNIGHKVLALSPDGTLNWYAIANGLNDLNQTPAIAADGTIYKTNGSDILAALLPGGGIKWTAPMDNGQQSGSTSPAIADDGTVYVGSGLKIYAFNPDGTEKWIYDTGSMLYSSPAIDAQGDIYFGTKGPPDSSTGGFFMALNADGTLKWEQPRTGVVDSSPVLDAAGVVYVGYTNCGLKAFYPDGTEKWYFPTPAAVSSSPVMGADGTLYFGDDSGWLYALGPGSG